jgi:RNA polymerase sigma-70 factor (ECF subfamily)
MDEVQPNSAETQQLLAQARVGDRQALDRLLACHRDYLLRFVELRLDKKVRARMDPSDVVQEAHLEAVRRLPDYLEQPGLPFRLWLRQLAYDRLLKARRHHVETGRRAVERDQPLPEGSSIQLAQRLLAAGATPSQQSRRRELIGRVRAAIRQLPEADREIVLLRHFEGLSNQEVGYLLGIDPGTASKRHGRAMLRLHQILFTGGLTESEL